MYKAGDKVTILRNCSGNRAGDEYTLKDYEGGCGFIAGHCTCGGDYWELAKGPKPKFKVRDRVRLNLNNLVSGNGRYVVEKKFAGNYVGFNGELVVTEVDIQVKCRPLAGKYEVLFNYEELELINNEQSNGSENKVGEIMSSIKTFVKNLALSADEKLLRKYGFKNECGEYTAEAREFSMQKACEEQEKAMVEVAKGLAAEEKENK